MPPYGVNPICPCLTIPVYGFRTPPPLLFLCSPPAKRPKIRQISKELLKTIQYTRIQNKESHHPHHWFYYACKKNGSEVSSTFWLTPKLNKGFSMQAFTKDKLNPAYHLICVVSCSIANTRLPMLTSPKHFTTKSQMGGHTLKQN